MKHALIATAVSLLIIFFSLFVGTSSDWYFYILFAITVALFFFGVVYIQEIYRNTIKDIAEPGGFIARFFSKKSTILITISIVISAILAFLFIASSALLLKLDGWLAFITLMFFASLASVYFILSYKKTQQSLKDEVKENHANQAGIVLLIFVFSLFASFIPSLIPSIQDYNLIIKDSVNFNNYTEHASERSIESSNNDVSRKLLNIIIISDSFRLVITNEVYKALSSNEENDTFSVFAFLFIFMSNLLKTFPYILSFIILSLGASKIAPKISKLLEPKIIKIYHFLKVKFNKTKEGKKEAEQHENN